MCAGACSSHTHLYGTFALKLQWTVKQFHYYTNEIWSTTHYRNPDSTGYTMQSRWTISVNRLCFIQLSVPDCQCMCAVHIYFIEKFQI